MKKLLPAVLSGAVMLAGCAGQAGVTETSLPFEVAARYFVKNTVTEVPVAITQKASFESVFGAAAVMGAAGSPTPIDFEKSFVIAVAEPETDRFTQLQPLSLTRQDNGLLFTYRALIGEKMSYRMRPSLVIVVDKTLQAPVRLQRKEERK